MSIRYCINSIYYYYNSFSKYFNELNELNEQNKRNNIPEPQFIIERIINGNLFIGAGNINNIAKQIMKLDNNYLEYIKLSKIYNKDNRKLEYDFKYIWKNPDSKKIKFNNNYEGVKFIIERSSTPPCDIIYTIFGINKNIDNNNNNDNNDNKCLDSNIILSGKIKTYKLIGLDITKDIDEIANL